MECAGGEKEYGAYRTRSLVVTSSKVLRTIGRADLPRSVLRESWEQSELGKTTKQ